VRKKRERTSKVRHSSDDIVYADFDPSRDNAVEEFLAFEDRHGKQTFRRTAEYAAEHIAAGRRNRSKGGKVSAGNRRAAAEDELQAIEAKRKSNTTLSERTAIRSYLAGTRDWFRLSDEDQDRKVSNMSRRLTRARKNRRR